MPGSDSNAAADEALRRICDREGKAIRFTVLRDAFARANGRWPSIEPAQTPRAPLIPNAWLELYGCTPTADQCTLARKAACAINRGDFPRFSSALKQMAARTDASGQNQPDTTQVMAENLRLIASRAGMLKDARKAWLRQLALLPNGDAWPDDASIKRQSVPLMLYGDGPVAQHNRIAIASRSAWGIAASPPVLAAVSRPPRNPTMPAA